MLKIWKQKIELKSEFWKKLPEFKPAGINLEIVLDIKKMDSQKSI